MKVSRHSCSGNIGITVGNQYFSLILRRFAHLLALFCIRWEGKRLWTWAVDSHCNFCNSRRVLLASLHFDCVHLCFGFSFKWRLCFCLALSSKLVFRADVSHGFWLPPGRALLQWMSKILLQILQITLRRKRLYKYLITVIFNYRLDSSKNWHLFLKGRCKR